MFNIAVSLSESRKSSDETQRAENGRRFLKEVRFELTIHQVLISPPALVVFLTEMVGPMPMRILTASVQRSDFLNFLFKPPVIDSLSSALLYEYITALRIQAKYITEDI